MIEYYECENCNFVYPSCSIYSKIKCHQKNNKGQRCNGNLNFIRIPETEKEKEEVKQV